jgi:hypothetical protein
MDLIGVYYTDASLLSGRRRRQSRPRFNRSDVRISSHKKADLTIGFLVQLIAMNYLAGASAGLAASAAGAAASAGLAASAAGAAGASAFGASGEGAGAGAGLSQADKPRAKSAATIIKRFMVFSFKGKFNFKPNLVGTVHTEKKLLIH